MKVESLMYDLTSGDHDDGKEGYGRIPARGGAHCAEQRADLGIGKWISRHREADLYIRPARMCRRMDLQRYVPFDED